MRRHQVTLAFVETQRSRHATARLLLTSRGAIEVGEREEDVTVQVEDVGPLDERERLPAVRLRRLAFLSRSSHQGSNELRNHPRVREVRIEIFPLDER